MLYDALCIAGVWFIITKIRDYAKERKQDKEILKRYKEELKRKDRES